MREKLFSKLDVYCDEVARNAAINMAIDEALLETAQVPSIRFYRWASPALSFGYFGRFADVAAYAGERDLVRRWTGGGIVLHGEDLTYCIVIPANEPAFAESSISVYEKVHRALQIALAARGQPAAVANTVSAGDPDTFWGAHATCVQISATRRNYPCKPDQAAGESPTPAREIASAPQMCFAKPVRGDVMLDGRKIAGAAQRRTRRGLLQQGSIQHVDVGNGLAQRFAAALAGKCEAREIDRNIVQRADQIAAQKYATEAWLRKH